MKTFNMNNTKHILFAAVAAVSLSTVAVAAHADVAVDSPTRTVHYSDLNLNTQVGVDTLYNRIRNAAQLVCGNVDPRRLDEASAAKACIDKAVFSSVTAVNNPKLTSEYNARTNGAQKDINGRVHTLMSGEESHWPPGQCDSSLGYAVHPRGSRSVSIDSVANEEVALASAWRLQRTGNFVAAFDLAQDALRRWPGSQALEHVSILALASCGSTQAALDAFRATSLSVNSNEDFLALEARLLKDLAFNARINTEATLAEAAQAYERIAQRTGGTYSRQNAALLWMLAGDAQRAVHLAGTVAKRVTEFNVPPEEEAAYFHWATLAEAALVLGDTSMLTRAVAAANPLCRQNSWARSRTLLQMRRLIGVRPECADIIESWYRPPVGLVLTPEATSAALEGASMVESGDMPALAYCTGAGQEADWPGLAARGIQLHIIYGEAPVGDSEVPPPALRSMRDASGRYASHTWSSLLLDESDDHERVCAETALGLSLGHADALRAPWVVLARPEGRWHAYRDADRASIRHAIAAGGNSRDARSRYGFLFADAVSYSSLNAADTRRYWTELLPKAAAAVLRRHADSIVLRKTWGDAVHAVFRTATAAASAALEMQAATAQLAEELERGRRLTFRIAVHYGAADHGVDPVEETPSIFGPQLSFAARIVPVAPPGGIFVTEPFAAQLSLEGAAHIDCSYVGTSSLAKSYGRVRLLALA